MWRGGGGGGRCVKTGVCLSARGSKEMGGSGACLSQPYGRVFSWTWSLPLKLRFLVTVFPRTHLSLPQKHWSYRHIWHAQILTWVLNLNPSLLTFKTHALTSKAISPSPIQSLFYMYAVSKWVACRGMHVHVRWLTGDSFFLPPNRSYGPNSDLMASVLMHWTILLAPNSVFIGFYHIINSPG